MFCPTCKSLMTHVDGIWVCKRCPKSKNKKRDKKKSKDEEKKNKLQSPLITSIFEEATLVYVNNPKDIDSFKKTLGESEDNFIELLCRNAKQIVYLHLDYFIRHTYIKNINIERDKVPCSNVCRGLCSFNVVGSESLESRVLDYKKRILKEIDHPLYDSVLFLDYYSEFIFIGVPTPMKEDGSQDLSNIYDAVENVVRVAKKRKLIVLRSTIIPGTTRKLAEKYDNHDFVFFQSF